MDLEVLKELVKVFENVGEGAREVFIYYLCFAYIPKFIIHLTVVGTVIFGIYKIYRIVLMYGASCRLHKAAGYYNDWNESDLNRVSAFLEEQYKK